MNELLTTINLFFNTVFSVSGNTIAVCFLLMVLAVLFSLKYYLTLRFEKQVFLKEASLAKASETDYFRYTETLLHKDRTIKEMTDRETIFRSFFTGSHDAFMVIEKGCFIDCNDAAVKIFGCKSKEDLILKSPLHFSPEFQPDGSTSEVSANSYFKETIETGVRHFEWLHKRMDGTAFQADVILSSMEAGDRVLQQAIVRDVTHEKTIQKELKAAKEQAENANAAKSEFLSSMSHEIRTPLNAIIGMTELSMDSGLNDYQADLISTIDIETSNLLDLVDDILDFSKIEAKKLELDKTDFNISSMLEDFVRSYSIRASLKGLDFILFIAPEIPPVISGDPGRLRQILSNLVSNALKFTSKGEISIFTDIDSMTEETITLRFKIADTGIGIPDDKQNQIFNSFTQADHKTSQLYGGTGLGTTISLELARMMNGEIKLESNPGAGSTFYLTAVFDRVEHVMNDFNAGTEIAHLRIMIVDTNKTSLGVLQRYLSACGCETTVSSDPPDAIKKLKSAATGDTPFDLAVVSFSNDRIDGFDYSRQIRSTHEIGTLPIIVVSARAMKGDIDKCKEIGIEGYLPKPVQRQSLIHAIQMISSSGSSETESPRNPITRHSLVEACKADFRILLVEDYSVNQKIVLKNLISAGYYIELAEDGKTAVDRFRTTHFDIILMDINMPVMNGIEATAEIRKSEAEKGKSEGDVIIIALTAETSDEEWERCLNAGMNDIITKPFRRNELVSVVDKWAMFHWESSKRLNVETELNKTKVLVIEDTPTSQQVIMNHLKKAGLDADLAKNGEQGVDAFAKNHYDLVIMDINMDVMDGYEATKQIRRLESNNRHTPIIAITANAVKSDMEACFKAGADDYASKPIKRKKLYEIIEKWLPGYNQPPLSNPVEPVNNAIEKIISSQSENPINYPQALVEFGNDKALLDQVLEDFIQNVETQIKEIQEALVSNNADIVQHQAHSIKGAAANLVAPALTKMASDLETAGKEHQLDNGQALLENITKEITRIKQFNETIS